MDSDSNGQNHERFLSLTAFYLVMIDLGSLVSRLSRNPKLVGVEHKVYLTSLWCQKYYDSLGRVHFGSLSVEYPLRFGNVTSESH